MCRSLSVTHHRQVLVSRDLVELEPLCKELTSALSLSLSPSSSSPLHLLRIDPACRADPSPLSAAMPAGDGKGKVPESVV
jgi:hypothetical protein